MDFLPQQNRRVSSEPLGSAADILAGGKHVVVIGGGDTGSDCIGTSFRQGALSVTQLEIMPAPPEHENKGLTWPNWPLKMRTSSSQAEGARREFAVLTQKFSGDDGKVAKLHCVHVDDKFKPIAGTEFDLDAQLVLLAMGFVHPVHEGLLEDARRRARPARQRPRQHLGLSDLEAERVLRRRHAPRPVAGGLGDPRRPPLRAVDRSVLDGDDEFAAVRVHFGGPSYCLAQSAGCSRATTYPLQFCTLTPSITTVDAELAPWTLEARMSRRSVPLIQRLRVIL